MKNLKCRRCEQHQAIIQQAEDSHYKEVYCIACGYKEWLKNFNKLRQ